MTGLFFREGTKTKQKKKTTWQDSWSFGKQFGDSITHQYAKNVAEKPLWYERLGQIVFWPFITLIGAIGTLVDWIRGKE